MMSSRFQRGFARPSGAALRVNLLVAMALACGPRWAAQAESELGACCFHDGSCVVVTRAQCENPRYCRGDANCDGVVDFLDIDPFVEALQGESSWPHPGCAWLNADCNGDLVVDFDDIDPFVAEIGATCLPSGLEGFWSGAGTECSAAQCLVDCNGNGVHDRIDVLSGTSQDCDLDLIPDECQDCDGDGLSDVCQIEAGAVPDVNENWIPDACEYDCNANGIPDAHEIAIGEQPDCNQNGVPDPCEVELGAARDCNKDLVPDECQFEGNDCNDNQRPDECDEDANQNGVPDDCEPPPARGADDAAEVTPANEPDGGLRTQTVDLNIYNGLLGACGSSPGACGGQLVPEALEVSRGAVTVANLNDTNGDGIVDRDQQEVVAANSAGRNEVDLMRLDLRRPTQFDPNSRVILAVLGGSVRAWQHPTKVEEQPLPFSFHPQALPPVLTLWIEALEPSTVLRDIHLRAEHRVAGNLVHSDEVRATAVWAERSLVKVTRSPLPGHNDIPDDADRQGFRAFINQSISQLDGTRFGLGTQRTNGQADTFTGGRILHEFTIQPPGVETLPTVTWDVTRQVFAQDHVIVVGSAVPTLWTPDFKRDFPEAKVPPQNVELPNDDLDSSDEDNQPTNRHIYSWDTPGQPLRAVWNNAEVAFWTRRDTFREFVRVRVGEGQQFQGTNRVLEGSRSSAYSEWHYADYLVRGPLATWVPDTAAAAASAVHRQGRGNGTVVVRLLSEAVTEGYTATYRANTRTWTLTGTSGATASVAHAQAQRGAQWRPRIDGRIELVVTQGSEGFTDTSRLIFSVFRAASPLGKRNVNALGAIDPSGPP